MGRADKITNASQPAGYQRRFVTYVYCVLAMLAVAAAIGVAYWGSRIGLSAEATDSVSKGFAALALFNLFALSAIEFLHWLLRDVDH